MEKKFVASESSSKLPKVKGVTSNLKRHAASISPVPEEKLKFTSFDSFAQVRVCYFCVDLSSVIFSVLLPCSVHLFACFIWLVV